MAELGFHQTVTGEIEVSKVPPNPTQHVSYNVEDQTIDRPKTPLDQIGVAEPIKKLVSPRPKTPVLSEAADESPATPTLPPRTAPPRSPVQVQPPLTNPFDETPLPALKEEPKHKRHAPAQPHSSSTDPNGESAVVVGVVEPEPLTDEADEEFQVALEVYGSFVVRCLCSRQFKLREWALDEVAKRLDVWHRRGKEREEKGGGGAAGGVGKKLKKKLAAKRAEGKKRGRGAGAGAGVGEESSSGNDPSASGESSSDDGEGGVGIEMVRLGWKKEVPAKIVDKDTFVSATYQMAKKGMNDTRERVLIQSLAIWDQLTRMFEVVPAFCYVSLLIF
jgi:hypothetical protein